MKEYKLRIADEILKDKPQKKAAVKYKFCSSLLNSIGWSNWKENE